MTTQPFPASLHALYAKVVFLCEGRTGEEIEAMFDDHTLTKEAGEPRMWVLICLVQATRNGSIARHARFA